MAALKVEEDKIPILERQATTLENQTTEMGILTEGAKSLAMGFSAVLMPAMMLINVIRGIVLAISAATVAQKAENKATKEGTKEQQKKAFWHKIAAAFGMAESASQ